MPPLLSSKIHNFPFRECLRTGFTATINVRTPWMLRYISTPNSSNTGHGPIPKNADDAHGERKGRLSGSVLILIGAFSSIPIYYLGSQLLKSNISISKQGPGFPISTSSTLPITNVYAPEHNISPKNMDEAYAEFARVIGKENISTEGGTLERHTSTEWSSYPAIPSQHPQYVLFPGSTEEVSKIMKICHARRIPVVAFSGGTSLEGHFANTRHGIAIDFTRMNSIISVDKDDLDAVVQPGVSYEELNEQLEKENLFFPPDPGPGAMIGGMIGTGCSGTNAYYYGTMREWVINVTAVLADGTIIKTRQRPRKSSAGYDLTKVFIGSEGTLGLVTEATVKITTKPQHESVAVVSFPTVRMAAECVSKFVETGVRVAAVELLDETTMKLINESGSLDREWEETPTLFIKFNGTPNGVSEQIQIVQEIAKSHGSVGFVFAKDKDEAEDLWTSRKTALWGAAAMKKHDTDHPWITDVAVPISKLADIIEETKKALKETGLAGAIVGHVGDGNFHSLLFFAEEERPIAEKFVHNMVNRAIQLEGTVTGEHGVGLVKRDYLNHEVGETTVDLMRKMKLAFDPLCLLNCDKVIRIVPEERKG